MVMTLSFALGLGWSLYQINNFENRVTKWPTLRILVSKNSMFQDVVESFQLENKVNVELIPYENKNELQGKLVDSRFPVDLITLNCRDLKEFINQKLLATVDRDLIPNVVNISPDFVGGKFDSGGAKSVAVSWGVYGFVYDQSKTNLELKSWKDVLKPQFKKKVSLINDTSEFISSFLKRGIFEVNTFSSVRPDVLKTQMQSLASHVVLSDGQEEEKFKTGEVWIAQVSSGQASELLKLGPNMKYFIPEEGATIWIQSLAIAEKSTNKELAHEFINYALNRDVAYATASALRESSVNLAIESTDIPSMLKPSFVKTLQISRISFSSDLEVTNNTVSSIWQSLGF
jgi:spermidine/putrescine-binding protein